MSSSNGAPGHTLLHVLPNGAQLYRWPFRSDLPSVDDPEVRIFRWMGEPQGSAPHGNRAVQALDAKEREGLMGAIVGATMRAKYHRRRFLHILSEALDRQRAFDGRVFGDMIAKYLGFEATATLGAVRSAIDHVFFAALRIAGTHVDDADDAGVTKAIHNQGSTGFALAEVALLRGKYRTWFEDVNGYRNALVHAGSDEQMGVYEVGSVWPEATDHTLNVMMIPDRSSLKKPRADEEPPSPPGEERTKKRKHSRPRSTRTEEWTFNERRRLDDLVKESVRGLSEFLKDVGVELWGGTSPPPVKGGDEHACLYCRAPTPKYQSAPLGSPLRVAKKRRGSP